MDPVAYGGAGGAPIMDSPRRGYVAYLLRLWEVQEREDTLWRASLERPTGGERRGFRGLAELFIFLECEICQRSQDRQKGGTR